MIQDINLPFETEGVDSIMVELANSMFIVERVDLVIDTRLVCVIAGREATGYSLIPFVRFDTEAEAMAEMAKYVAYYYILSLKEGTSLYVPGRHTSGIFSAHSLGATD